MRLSEGCARSTSPKSMVRLSEVVGFVVLTPRNRRFSIGTTRDLAGCHDNREGGFPEVLSASCVEKDVTEGNEP